jgi:hypothetical protein
MERDLDEDPRVGHIEEGLRYYQMPGTRYRQELGESLYDSQDNRLE